MENKEKDSNTAEKPSWLTEEFLGPLITSDFANFAKIRELNVAHAVKTGENYTTVLLRVECELEMTDGALKQSSYLLKTEHANKDTRDMIRIWRVFEKEQIVYTQYIPAFEQYYKTAGKQLTFGARLLQATANKPEDMEVLIMSDLKLQGFKNGVRQLGLDQKHMEAVLEKLAQFHAASACYYEAHGAYPQIYEQNLCGEVDEGLEAYRAKVTELLLTNLKQFEAENLKEELLTYAAAAPDQFHLGAVHQATEFCVLNHGDCWTNNIMFQYDDAGHISETLFVDFQMCRYSSPAQDLWYLLLSSAKLEQKLKYFDCFVAFYHEKLLDNLKLLKYGKLAPTLKDLHIAMFRYADWAYCVASIVLPTILFDSSDKANYEDVLSNDDLKQSMYSSARYAAHMKEILPWLAKRGLLDYVPLK